MDGDRAQRAEPRGRGSVVSVASPQTLTSAPDMQSCFVPLLLFAIGVLVLMTLFRWFEQTAEAVDNGWWDKLLLLVFAPFVVWLFPGKVGAGRPTPVPRHEPVRGFAAVSKKTP